MKFNTINGWTKESMKEAVRRHVPRSSFGCWNTEKGSCVYFKAGRNGKEQRCAVGAFLPKEYEPKVKEGDVEELLYDFPELCKILPLKQDGLSEMQTVHDYNKGPDAQRRVLKWIEQNVVD